MVFKYLKETMSAEDARKTYRTLAKSMHPDLGGDEEEFKVLANEYAYLMRRDTEAELTSVRDIMIVNAQRMGTVVRTLQELYPRTKVLLHYSLLEVEAEFSGNVPIARMVEIEQVINSFGYPLRVFVSFYREGRKSAIRMKTERNCVTYINMEPNTPVDMENAPTIYQGRRYTIKRNAKYEECLDAKLQRRYVMKRMPKFTLTDLMGLGK